MLLFSCLNSSSDGDRFLALCCDSRLSFDDGDRGDSDDDDDDDEDDEEVEPDEDVVVAAASVLFWPLAGTKSAVMLELVAS